MALSGLNLLWMLLNVNNLAGQGRGLICALILFVSAFIAFILEVTFMETAPGWWWLIRFICLSLGVWFIISVTTLYFDGNFLEQKRTYNGPNSTDPANNMVNTTDYNYWKPYMIITNIILMFGFFGIAFGINSHMGHVQKVYASAIERANENLNESIIARAAAGISNAKIHSLLSAEQKRASLPTISRSEVDTKIASLSKQINTKINATQASKGQGGGRRKTKNK